MSRRGFGKNGSLLRLAGVLAACSATVQTGAREPHRTPPPTITRSEPTRLRAGLGFGALGWQELEIGAIRGITVGPIESLLHPGRGYGSPAFQRLLREARRWDANWLSLTPFGRVWDLRSTGVALSFEAPFSETRSAVLEALTQAHAAGLRVLLVPHLWVESGEWRALIDPGDDSRWKLWAQNYRRFILAWAEVAREGQADMLALGVEMRGFVTTRRGAQFLDILQEVRSVYPGLLTYAGNWDDVEETVILGQLDLIGVNAFYPLAEAPNASFDTLLEQGRKVANQLRRLAERWQKPLVLTEFGYTTRPDPALRPWEWPDTMRDVVVDEAAQAQAYQALLQPLLEEPSVAGAFVWRLYSDPDDLSQEAAWGFSPRGKQAELVLRDAFRSHWAADGPRLPGDALARHRAEVPGVF